MMCFAWDSLATCWKMNRNMSKKRRKYDEIYLYAAESSSSFIELTEFKYFDASEPW